MTAFADVRIRSLIDTGLGNSSYVVEIGDGRAITIDPPRDVDRHRAIASTKGLALSYSIETHLHADFVSGSRELAVNGTEIVAPRRAHMEFPYRGLEDGEDFDLGGLTLRALATPGHTPEHLSYLLLDGRHPKALFSGGSLLVESLARTDLIAPEQTEPLARAMYRSLRERILPLPDDLPVYPTHGAGSFCSTGPSGERTTTIGRERRRNPFLGASDEDQFVTRLLASFGSYPPYFLRLREVNRRGARVVGRPPQLQRLNAATFERHRADGAEVLDARSLEQYAAGHIQGSLANPLRPAFVSWLGWLVAPERPLLFVLDRDQDRFELVRQALRIGHERLLGELEGGIEAWISAGYPVARTRVLAPTDPRIGPLIDVRQAVEYASGHVPGATHLELGSLVEYLEQLPRSVTFMCGHGERAIAASSLAERSGLEAAVMAGGPSEWSATQRQPLATGR